MKQTAKRIAPLLLLLAAVALFLGLYLTARPTTVEGAKSVTVTVTHGDGSSKVFDYQTDLTYLGELLLTEGLVKGDQGAYGLYITEVDGEVADYTQNKAYWSLLVDETYATQGADTTPLTHGSAYALVYTIG